MKRSISVILVAMALQASFSCNESPVEKAKRIHEEVLTVDSHTDTPWFLIRGGFDLDARHDYRQEGSRIDFVRMREGGLDAVFMAAFVGQRGRDEEGNRKAREMVMKTIDSIRSNIAARPATSGLALSPDDAYRLEKEGKRAIFIGIENGYAIGNDIQLIGEYYSKGARYITLCHTRNNDISDSSTDSAEFNGLSAFGEEVVREMNRVGMMVDVSHISDSAFYDVLRITTKPVIASHSSARAVCDSPRNLNDDMLRKLAENGGVVQVCILSEYVKKAAPYPERDNAFDDLKNKYGDFNALSDSMAEVAWKEWDGVDSLFPRKLATVSDLADHIDHIVDIAGIDHVGIGTDFDGGGGLADCTDASQLGNITMELVSRGYSEEEIRKIWGGNIMRVMAEVTDGK